MKNRIIGVVVVLAVVAGGAVWWQRRHSAAPASQPVAVARSNNGSSGPTTTAATQADSLPARIMGRVLDENAQPIKAAVVVARVNNDPDATRATVTAADGSFLLLDVPAGVASLTASAPEFEPTTNEDVSLNADKTTKIDITLHRGGVPISGLVKDAGGGPISGVRVDATLATARTAPGATRNLASATASAFTGTDGRYTISIGVGTVQMTASHAEYGLQRQVVQHEIPGSQADFALLPGAVVEGIVRDRATGEPVAGVTVLAQRDGQGPTLGGARGGKSVRSNDAGMFRIAGLSPGNHVLMAQAAGRRTEQPVAIGLGIAEQLGGVELWLVPAATLGGTVVDQQGQPVADALVFATNVAGAQLESTDAKGQFEFSSLRAGDYELVARKAGAASAMQVIALTATAMAPVKLVLPPSDAIVLHGHVEPRGIATITAEVAADRMSMEPVMLGNGIGATSNANGDFELRDVPRGRWQLQAVGADGARGHTEIEVVAASSGDIVIKLEPGASITGRVVDQDGKALRGAIVMAAATTGSVRHVIKNGAVTSGQQIVTDSNGVFALRGLSPNTYQLSVLDRGRPIEFAGAQPKPIVLAAGAAVTGIELKVKRPNGVLRGIVLGLQGAPQAEAWVTVRLDIHAMMANIAGSRSNGGASPKQPNSGPPNPSEAEHSEVSETIEISDDEDNAITPVMTNADGTFEIHGLASGHYEVLAEAQAGSLRGRASSAASGAPITIKLSGLTELRGIVSANGKPVTDYNVKISGPMQSTRAVTSATGEYRFIRVDPGTYKVEVSSDAGHGTGEITVTANAVATLDIQLASDGIVTGRLVDSAGKAVAGAPIVVVPEQAPGTPQQITLNGPPPMSKPDGSFKLTASAGPSVVLALGGPPTSRGGIKVISGQTLDVGTIVQGTNSNSNATSK